MIRQKRIKFGLKWIKKEKKYKKRGRRRENEVADADEEEIESWFFSILNAKRER